MKDQCPECGRKIWYELQVNPITQRTRIEAAYEKPEKSAAGVISRATEYRARKRLAERCGKEGRAF